MTQKLEEIWKSLPASSEFEDLRLRFLSDDLRSYLTKIQDVRHRFFTFVVSCCKDTWTSEQMEAAIDATGSLLPLET